MSNTDDGYAFEHANTAEQPTVRAIERLDTPIVVVDVAPAECVRPALSPAMALAEYDDPALEDLAYAGRLAEDELFRRGRR